MTTYSFPALGFDPAPGDPDEVEGVGRHCARAARALEEDAARLEALQRSQWAGEASDALKARVARLRRDYSSSGRAYTALSMILLHFSEAHRQAQIAARRAEDDAAEAKRRMEGLEREVERLEAELKSAPPGTDMGPVLQQLMETRRRWSWAEESYQSARATAERIQTAFEEEGDFAARRLRAIDPPPYVPPRHNLFQSAAGWMGDRVNSVAHAVDRFVDEHADVLRSVSGPLKAVSAAAGLLSFVPFLTPLCAPLAAGTAVAALGLDATLVAAGHGSWKAVAVDAGLMALPVAGRLVSRAVMGRQAAKVATQYADEVLRSRAFSRTTRPSTVAALRTRNPGRNMFAGASRGPTMKLHPRLQEALDRVPEAARSQHHGKCAEIRAINEALDHPASVKDAVIETRFVRKPSHPNHGLPHAPCPSCERVLRQLGIKYLERHPW